MLGRPVHPGRPHRTRGWAQPLRLRGWRSGQLQRPVRAESVLDLAGRTR